MTNRWASGLRARGVKPDELVAVALDRGVDLLAAYLAVLKAGAAFVPFDLTYPRERLLLMLQRCGATRMIATRATAQHLLPRDGDVITIDDLAATQPLARTAVPKLPPSAAAYGIFTSGSTGVPNCVIVTHAAIANTLAWRQRWMPLQPGDRILQAMSP